MHISPIEHAKEKDGSFILPALIVVFYIESRLDQRDVGTEGRIIHGKSQYSIGKWYG